MVKQVDGNNAHYTPSNQSTTSSISLSQEANAQKHWPKTQILNDYISQCNSYHRIFIHLVNRLESSI
ncbi:hypothetical protein [Bacteroides propionicifaciens]|jgi:hypothetical protein|uniref:hypothetical protein n=1 Tax=Bacteroides propionicifaciens TaxID=392838 RepID=UPI000469B084|nr:hypothetical protein [Bacteroides propionicifaciens]